MRGATGKGKDGEKHGVGDCVVYVRTTRVRTRAPLALRLIGSRALVMQEHTRVSLLPTLGRAV